MYKLLFFVFFSVCYASNSRTIKVHTISDQISVLGGSPHWDNDTLSLYYVDLFGSQFDILRFDWREKKTYKTAVPIDLDPKVVVFILPLKCAKDLFAIGVANRFTKIIRWDGRSPTVEIIKDVFAVEQDPQYATNFWHIAEADPKGRFFGGTFRSEFCSSSSSANASLYRFTEQHGVERIRGNMKVPCGMDWDPKRNIYYFVDGCIFTVLAYDWDPTTGKVCNGRPAFKFNFGQEAPDYAGIGVTVDRKGMIYTSMYNASAVWKINPWTHKLLKVIEMPTQLVVNLAFGGPNLDVLFVTSAKGTLGIYSGKSTNQTLTDVAGSLFMIEGLNARGFNGRKLNLLKKNVC